MKRRIFIPCCFCLCALLFTADRARGQWRLIDDFEDGDIDGWTVYDYTAGTPYGPSRFSVVNGAFEISNGLGQGEVHPIPNALDALYAVWEPSSDPIYQHGFLRTKLRTLEATGGPDIVLRSMGAGLDGYEFNLRSYVDAIVIERISNGGAAQVGRANSIRFDPGQDWIVEVGAVGPRLSFKAWEADEDEPQSPQVIIRDTMFTGGRFGLGIFQAGTSAQDFGRNQPFGVRYDNVMFRPAAMWSSTSGGNWSTAANWWGNVPNTAGIQAMFDASISAPTTVTLDVPITLGQIDFNNQFSYTLAGAHPLTFDAAEGDVQINVARGAHRVDVPVTITDNATVNVAPATSGLSLSNDLEAIGLTKVGAGTLTVNQFSARGLSINAGAVAIAGNGTDTDVPASVVQALSIAGGATPTAKLDLMDQAAIINYNGASPIAAIREQIVAGRGGSGLGKTWNGQGITSSAAATANATEPESRSIGYADNSALPLGPYSTFRGQPVDDTSLLMAFTRTGDANLDGVVNDADVTIVSATYAPGVPQPHWALGDFDYNGFVDDADVTLLSALYDPSAPPLLAATAATGGIAAVPEPAALALGVTGLLILYPLVRRKKPRRFG
jgi:hypothetical protein